jgi:hypothetical protein
METRFLRLARQPDGLHYDGFVVGDISKVAQRLMGYNGEPDRSTRTSVVPA